MGKIKHFLIIAIGLFPFLAFSCDTVKTLDIEKPQEGALCPNGTITIANLPTNNALHWSINFTIQDAVPADEAVIKIKIGSGINRGGKSNIINLNGKDSILVNWDVDTSNAVETNTIELINTSHKNIEFKITGWDYRDKPLPLQ